MSATPTRQLTIWHPVQDVGDGLIECIAEAVPDLEIVTPGWLVCRSHGPARYFGGEERCARYLIDLAGDAGFAVGVGIADGRLAAGLAARRSARSGRPATPVIIAPGGTPGYLARHRLDRLVELGDVDAHLVDLFGRLGLRTCGDLARLPAERILARFGPAGRRAWSLAAGDDERPLLVSATSPTFDAERVFETPVVDLQPIVFSAKTLADQLTARLDRAGLVCRRLVATAETDHGERSERHWYRDGGFDAAEIVQRVRWQLEGWIKAADMTAGVVLLRLVADLVGPAEGIQTSLWGGRSRADDDAARATARLAGLVGHHAVTVPVWSGGRLPAERYRWTPALEVETPSVVPAGTPWPGALPPPAPAIVHERPVPVGLIDETGAAVVVGGRGEISSPPAVLRLDGTEHRLTDWAGPWPIEQRWWDPRRHRRLAHLQVVDDSSGAWLLAAERRRWWLVARYL